jgi:hypothetical protein
MRLFVQLSAQIIAVDTPAHIDTQNAADAAQAEGRHESHLRSDPPPDPAQDRHTDKNAEFVHDSSIPNTNVRRQRLASRLAAKPVRCTPRLGSVLTCGIPSGMQLPEDRYRC